MNMLQSLPHVYVTPTAKDIFHFASTLFNRVDLSDECSIVCLVYIERLMTEAGVALLARNWRPIVLCALLLASKVWQDLATWNVEFADASPTFSLEAINQMEQLFVRHLRFNLYISGALYARYYFALRSMAERSNFRRRYLTMVQPSRAPRQQAIEQKSLDLNVMLYSKSS